MEVASRQRCELAFCASSVAEAVSAAAVRGSAGGSSERRSGVAAAAAAALYGFFG